MIYKVNDKMRLSEIWYITEMEDIGLVKDEEKAGVVHLVHG